MIFCRTVYLWAVEWEHWQSPQGLKGKARWITHRTRWGEIKGALRFRDKLLKKPFQKYIRNVRIIRRPVGRVRDKSK